VAFENVMPWKMWVTITAVCDPYKYELEETSITKILSASGVQVIITPTENVSREYYNSLFLFGSPSVPTANLDMFDRITISWGSDNDVYSHSPTVEIYDSDGGHLILSISDPLERVTFPIAVSTLSEQYINTAKIYRIAVNGIGSAGITFQGNAIELEIENGRKTIAPSVQVQSNYASAVEVWLNNAHFVFGIGTSTNPRMVLMQGTNKIVMKPTDGCIVTLRFRRGWL
jgi:hypothetical protein